MKLQPRTWAICSLFGVQAFLLLSGCVTHVNLELAAQQLSAFHLCCANISLLPFQTITPGSNVSPVVDASTPAFAFEKDGISHFEAFRIAGSSTTMRLEVRAYTFSDGYPAKRTIAFVPKIVLFDSDMKLVSSTNFSQIKYVSSDWDDEPSKTAKIEVTIDIKPSDKPSYIVIYTPEQYVGSKMEFIAPEPGPTIRMGKSYVSAGPGLEAIFITGSPVAPVGNLSIKLVAQ